MQTTTDDRARPSVMHTDQQKSVHAFKKREQRSQACTACRATKTKCVPSERPDSCQSCLRNSRTCVMPGPRKPRMKSAQKFSELEKKIELLTNALVVRGQNSSGGADYQNLGALQTPTDSSDEVSPSDKDIFQAQTDPRMELTRLPERPALSLEARLDATVDALVGRETATRLFAHWNNNMRYLVPMFPFRSDMTMAEVRETRPVLFFAILTVASTSTYPSISKELVSNLTNELGQQMFVRNVQSTDLILATLLFSHYYFQPGESTNLAPSQFIYAAVGMSSDLGLHTKIKNSLDTDSPDVSEAARVCLSQWYAASTTSTAIHRESLIRHSPVLVQCSDYLRKMDQLPSSWTYEQLQLQQIIEAASLLVNASESKGENAFDEPGTQYRMNMLQQQLDSWEHNLPDNVDKRLKEYSVCTAYLNIHAIAIRCFVRKVAIQKQASKTARSSHDEAPLKLTPLHVDCLIKCLSSLQTALDIYLSFDISFARCLPNTYLFRNICAALMLIKLGHFGEMLAKLEQSPGSQDPAMPRTPFHKTVVYYLDAIATKTDQISQDGFMPQARPYIKVLRKFKPYFLQKREVCITSQGNAVEEGQTISCDGSHGTHDSSQSHTKDREISLATRSRMQFQQEPQIQQHSQPDWQQHSLSKTNTSQNQWMTSESTVHQGPFETSPFMGSSGNEHNNGTVDNDDMYDPSTYANTDWNMLTLDQDAMDQLDSLMWADEDSSWMKSLF